MDNERYKNRVISSKWIIKIHLLTCIYAGTSIMTVKKRHSINMEDL